MEREGLPVVEQHHSLPFQDNELFSGIKLPIVAGGCHHKKMKNDKNMVIVMNFVIFGDGGAAQAHRVSLTEDAQLFLEPFKANASWIAYGSPMDHIGSRAVYSGTASVF